MSGVQQQSCRVCVCVCVCVWCGTVPRFFKRRSRKFTRLYILQLQSVRDTCTKQKQAELIYLHSAVCIHQPFIYIYTHLFASMLHYYGVILHALLLILHIIFYLFYKNFRTLTDYLCSVPCYNLFCPCIL